VTHPIIGSLITERDAQRDAIHLAIAPVIAQERLAPGQRVGLVNGIPDAAAHPIGIVDPFLNGPVFKGEGFWLFLYPGSITSLRHDWAHPSFPVKESVRQVGSEKWVREFAETVGLSYERLMDGAKTFVESGDYLCEGGLLEGESVPEEFWSHYENITGTVVPENSKDNFFTCRC